jgi:hypothetical protein
VPWKSFCRLALSAQVIGVWFDRCALYRKLKTLQILCMVHDPLLVVPFQVNFLALGGPYSLPSYFALDGA